MKICVLKLLYIFQFSISTSRYKREKYCKIIYKVVYYIINLIERVLLNISKILDK